MRCVAYYGEAEARLTSDELAHLANQARARNAARSGQARVISPDGARVVVAVVPTNEELAIARQTADLVG